MRDGKVLITGGLGFIGQHVAGLLVEQGWHVLLFDNLSPQVHGAVPQLPVEGLLQHPRVEIYRGDVRQPEDWRRVLRMCGVSCTWRRRPAPPNRCTRYHDTQEQMSAVSATC